MACLIELEEEHAFHTKGRAYQLYERDSLDLKKRHALTVDMYGQNGCSMLGVFRRLQ